MMIPWAVALLLKASIVLGVARVVSGVHVRGFLSALGVALVYGLLSFLLGWILKILAFPLILLTLGLFLLVINGALLWLTDKMLTSFEIEDRGALAKATVLMSAGFVGVEFLVSRLFGI